MIQIQYILKAEFKEAIKKDPMLMALIAKANYTTNRAIDEWRRKDEPMLTTATNLAIIRNHLGLGKNVELTEPKEETETVKNRA